jgi:hypothetical protein
MDGKILNSEGFHVATILGSEIFDPAGGKLYDLKGTRIYKTTGELVGIFVPRVPRNGLIRRPTNYSPSDRRAVEIGLKAKK